MANFKLEKKDVRLTDGKFITNLDVCANNVIATSNVEATYFVGSARYLTDLPEANTALLVSNTYLQAISNTFGTGDVSNTYLQTQLDDSGAGGVTVAVDTTSGSVTYLTNASSNADGSVVNIIFKEHPGITGTPLANTFLIQSTANNLIYDPEGTTLADGDTITFTETHSNLRLISNGSIWFITADNTNEVDGVSNSYLQTVLPLDGSGFVSNTYASNTFVGNTYATATFTSNTYVSSTFASNTYATATYSSNNYNAATYASNTYASNTFAGNVYVTTTLDTKEDAGTAVAMAIALG